MHIKSADLNYELYKSLCEANSLSCDRLASFIDERRIIVEPVDDPSSLHLTIINDKKEDGQATNIRFFNVRLNIKKLVLMMPSLVLDVFGLKSQNPAAVSAYGIRIAMSVLGLFSITLKADESAALFVLWRMNEWGKDIPWERAFEETAKRKEEISSEGITEAEFAKALETLNTYKLIELNPENVAFAGLDHRSCIRVKEHLLYRIEKR